MSNDVAKARERLDKAAIVIGSCLVDGIDPDWDAQQEIEAACVEYVRALRAEPTNTKAKKRKD